MIVSGSLNAVSEALGFAAYSMDANKAIQIGSYVAVDSETRTIARTGKQYEVILSIRPKTDADRKKETLAKKKAAQIALKEAEATLGSDEVLDLDSTSEELPEEPEAPENEEEDIPDADFGDEPTNESPEETARKAERAKKAREARAKKKADKSPRK